MASLLYNRPGGLPGNDDLGAMSAWYVFSALGMYPQVPSAPNSSSARPLFPRIEIDRPAGKDISIRAEGAAADAPYVRSLKVNGRADDRPWLPASFVEDGGTLDYTLSRTPNRSWGADAADAPPSFREGEQPYQVGVGPTRRRSPRGRRHRDRDPRPGRERRRGAAGALPRRGARRWPPRPPPREC